VETIFVQIASYRDPELIKTIRDCLKKAKYSNRISFGICYQYSENDIHVVTDPELQISCHELHWKLSKGVGWARSECNKLYKGEDYTLQIDSHCRFEQDWDEKIIDIWKQCKHPKAILSGYPPGYEYKDDKEVYTTNMPLMTMVVKNFDVNFIPTFKSAHILNGNSNKPCRGSFVAAGFLFTIGSICKEVPYLEDIYFTGEEISYSLRSFTHGYRVFYPHKWLIYHLYERKNYNKHWEDFINDETLKPIWEDMQVKSYKLLYDILNDEPSIHHLFGKVNTFENFENYSGLKLKERIIHPKQLKGFEPPIEFSSNWN
jgi:hypothetical protein